MIFDFLTSERDILIALITALIIGFLIGRLKRIKARKTKQD